MSKFKILITALTFIFTVAISSVVLACDDDVTDSQLKPAPAHMQAAFKRLIKMADLRNADQLRVYVRYGDMSKNASIYDNGLVVMTEGNVVFTQQFPDQLYFILAHEIMHWKHGDLHTRHAYCDKSLANSRSCEKQADLAGKRLMKKAGFDHCSGGNYWFRWLHKYGDTGKGGSHPSAKERYEYLRCY